MTKIFNIKPKPIKIKPPMRAEFMLLPGPSSFFIEFLTKQESISFSLLCKYYYDRVEPAQQKATVLKELKYEFSDFIGLCRNSN